MIKNGNLLSKESSLKTEKYTYNSQNRLCESVVIDRENKTQAVSYYGYDAFGRRVVVQDRDEAYMRSLYDGFTFDVIKQSPTLANGMFVDSNETGIRLNRTGRATGDRYRYLDDDKNDGNRYFYLDEGNYRAVTSRYVGERTSIAVNGVVAGQNAGGEVSYFTTDLLGSVRSTTDSTGFGTNSYTYDVFGSLVEGDLNGAADYGYLGKQFDAQTGLYNYGYRDYAPGVARFTTVDPIRDGENWFAYVNNDPVNFVDLWGLSASDATSSANYDQIMNEISKLDLSNGVPYDYVFSKETFNSDHSLNQLNLDKALGIESNSKTTKSCQTAALLNAYANGIDEGLTGKEILGALKKSDGTLNSNLDIDGSPKNLYNLSKDIAEEKGLDKMLSPADKKNKITNDTKLDETGAIIGVTKNGKDDQHFMFKNNNKTVDSLDPNRPAAKNYSENTYRNLTWKNIK